MRPSTTPSIGLRVAGQHRHLVVVGRGGRDDQVVGDHDAGGHAAMAVHLHDRRRGLFNRGFNLVGERRPCVHAPTICKAVADRHQPNGSGPQKAQKAQDRR